MTSSEPKPQAAAQPRKRRLWLKIGVPVAALVVIGAALWVWATLSFVYSSGERTGYVKSLTQRGWLCKTWEGELTPSRIPGVPGVVTDTNAFDFTVRNDSVARALQLAVGKQVTLSYGEHRGVPTTCFGESEYFVQAFRVVQ